MNDKSLEELLALANAYIDRRLDEDGKSRLTHWLKDDPEARRVFRDFLQDQSAFFDGGLTTDGGRTLDPPSPATPPRQPLAWLLAAGAAGFLLALGLLLLVRLLPTGGEGTLPQANLEAVDSGAVVSVYATDGQASANPGATHTLQAGDILRAGDVLTMEEGVIELVFRGSGVHATASGPLSMEIISQFHVHLRSGEVRLQVPPQGIGFVVEADGRRITDLGTEFVVKARPKGSRVLVLDGQVTISQGDGEPGRLMGEGEFADFQSGQPTHFHRRPLDGLPQLSPVPAGPEHESLTSTILTFPDGGDLPRRNPLQEDRIGRQLLPLVRSGFRDTSSLDGLIQGGSHPFGGIAGSFMDLPERLGIGGYSKPFGWMAWCRGQAVPPQPGRYRFWGYADNHLLVAIDGQPVFEGSRFGSAFREDLAIPRRDHPAFPCLNSKSGFVAGGWFQLDGTPVSLDLLFGEQNGSHTSAILLIEREGETCEETFWSQPKWPIFLVGQPSSSRTAELQMLADYLERTLIGAFSVSSESVWQVAH